MATGCRGRSLRPVPPDDTRRKEKQDPMKSPILKITLALVALASIPLTNIHARTNRSGSSTRSSSSRSHKKDKDNNNSKSQKSTSTTANNTKSKNRGAQSPRSTVISPSPELPVHDDIDGDGDIDPVNLGDDPTV